jgi:hypothetical protein
MHHIHPLNLGCLNREDEGEGWMMMYFANTAGSFSLSSSWALLVPFWA